jgi:hypothetical protein
LGHGSGGAIAGECGYLLPIFPLFLMVLKKGVKFVDRE